MSFDAHHDHQPRPAKRTPPKSGEPANADGDLARWLGAGRVDQIRAALAAAGVELIEPHLGRIVTNEMIADVLLEPDDLVQVRCGVEIAQSPRALLERAAGAAGSVRFAVSRSGQRLVAETRVNGVAHLPDSLRRICRGFTHVLDGSASTSEQEADSEPLAQSLNAAIKQAGWQKEDAVETARGYELHMTLEGARTTVEVTARSDSALVRRTVLARFPDSTAGSAIAHQSLAIHARLRGCRLVVSDEGLHVESHLHASQIDGDWLAFTVRAVGHAARSIEPELQLLADEPAVAEAYAKMFCTSEHAS